MFTGLIEELGTVEMAGSRLQIRCHRVLADLITGASIAVNGVCVTAVRIQPDGFGADLSPETLSRTSLGSLTPGSLVNLERPLAIGDRLGGHIVQGHVDGTAQVLSLDPLRDGNWELRVSIPPELARYMIYKGSVAIDGVSLTIASIQATSLCVAIIPHTFQNTSMQTYKPGTRLNIEVDQIAKYIEKLLPQS
jgi:riboflavin synthase